MITLLPAPDHVIAYHIREVLSGEEFDQIAAAIDQKLRRHDKVALLVDTIGLSDVTGEALAKRIRYGLSKMTELHRFPRVALITDKEWMRALAGFSRSLLPSTEVRTFGDGERDAAMAWVSRPL